MLWANSLLTAKGILIVCFVNKKESIKISVVITELFLGKMRKISFCDNVDSRKVFVEYPSFPEMILK